MMGIAVTQLPEVLVVHEHRDMDEFQLGQDRKQGLPQVQDGNLTSRTRIEPFRSDFDWQG